MGEPGDVQSAVPGEQCGNSVRMLLHARHGDVCTWLWRMFNPSHCRSQFGSRTHTGRVDACIAWPPKTPAEPRAHHLSAPLLRCLLLTTIGSRCSCGIVSTSVCGRGRALPYVFTYSCVGIRSRCLQRDRRYCFCSPVLELYFPQLA